MNPTTDLFAHASEIVRGPNGECAQAVARAAKLTAVPDADADVVDLDAVRQMRGGG